MRIARTQRTIGLSVLALLAFMSITILDAEAQRGCRAVEIDFGLNEPKLSQLKAVLKTVSCNAVRIRPPIVKFPEPYEFGTSLHDAQTLARELENIARHGNIEVQAVCGVDNCIVHSK